MSFRLVIVESPFAGRGDTPETRAADQARNIAYARAAMADCLARNEAPFASHALYTLPGVLNDDDPAERRLGIAAGLAWGERADATVVFTDRGLTPGMREGIDRARIARRPVEMRSLPGWKDPA
ncbi:hypothetical protein [Methylobacterium sp. CCH5-D2]|uniref:DUF7768 domain-containing protein n=1 Tax=Methylobacterium sp. CCH5-D2 TaxID=1768765 RepID=UPI000833CD1D|nr:hypothetical protein [Methylobacterium sp. CCH5-D2]